MHKLTLLEISAEEHTQLTALAHQRGYEAQEDYVRALINADAQEQGESVLFERERTREEILEGIKQGMREAVRALI